MAIFPALRPSTRDFNPGDYPHTSFVAMSGKQNSVRHSDAMVGSRLNLRFGVIEEADMLSIVAHYHGQKGGWQAFALPEIAWSGAGNASDYTLTNYAWRYIEPPRVEDLMCGGHYVDVSLESVPGEGFTVLGSSFTVGISIATIGAAAANGSAFTIGMSLEIGAAFISGINQTVTLSIATDPTTGGVSAFAPGTYYELGISLLPGTAFGPRWFFETIAMSLVTGSAYVGGVDPYFQDVGLLLHMNGSNGSTTFTDSSSNNIAVTAYGNAQISTTQSKFGGASGLFDGNGDYLLATDSVFSPGTGDFTGEGWMYVPSGLSGYKCIFSLTSGSDDNSLYFLGNTLLWWDNGVKCISATFASNTWLHFAATRQSGTVRVFLHGVKSATDHTSNNNINSGSIRIGTRGAATGEWFDGYIDDFRWTEGVARYTSDFIPMDAPHPDAGP